MDISELKSKYDEYAFNGRRGWPNLFGATRPVIDLGPIGFGGENVVETAVGTYGVMPASEVDGTPDRFDQNMPTSVYLIDSNATSYNGLRRVYNLRGRRNLQFYAPFVEDEVLSLYGHAGYMAEVASEFGGFSVIGSELGVKGIWQSGTCTITIYSAKGAAYDNLIFSRKLINRNRIEHMYDPPRQLAPGDRLDLTHNGGGYAAVKLYIRKLR